MARPLRLEFPGAVYHVTSRGNARGDIFVSDADRELFLNIFADTVERYNWLCHAYCLMDNHYHLLFETLDPNLSLGMRQLNGSYTQAFNRNHQRVGHVFQGRYKSILVERGAHLLELCRYVALNPVAAGMVTRPEDWPWSSYRATAGFRKAPAFLSTDWVLNQFSRQEKAARRRYVDFVDDGMKKDVGKPWSRLKGQVFFGGASFVAMMQDKLVEFQDMGEIPRMQRFPGRPSLAKMFAGVTDKHDRNRKIRRAHREYGYTLKEIGDNLGVHYSTISRVVKSADA